MWKNCTRYFGLIAAMLVITRLASLPEILGMEPQDAQRVIRQAPPSLAMELVLIRGATFTMGPPVASRDKRFNDEPRVVVTVNDFRIGKYLVTTAQLCECLNAIQTNSQEQNSPSPSFGGLAVDQSIVRTGGRFEVKEGAERCPCVVTWNGAVFYCEWLSKRDGRRYRLPSEAEWELAAKGQEDREWPWGNEDPTPAHGERFQKIKYSPQRKEPAVGSFPKNASPEGVLDLVGYYSGQWCANKYVEMPGAGERTCTDVDIGDTKSNRMVRGHYRKDTVRYPGRFGKILAATEYGWEASEGRAWTRVSHGRTAYHQFRVVRDDEKSTQ